MNTTFLFLCIGFGAGILSGLFGIGGGILIVPLLVTFASFTQLQAQGTSLGALLLPVGLLGAYKYYQLGNIDFKASLLIAVAMTFGALGGASLANALPAHTMQKIFGGFLILVGIRFLLK
jgi:uncharacterized protein